MVELPHARIPGGPSTLVILEGLTLENKEPTGRALRLLRWAHKRYTRDYTVYQVARRPGLPAGHSTRDMADDYASWIGARFEGPVDVIGFSTGGEVAQYLAADHGERVRRLVLSDTGCRLGEDAKALLRAARDKAAHGRAAEAQADIAHHMDLGHDATDALSRIAAPTLVIAGSRDFFYPDPIVRETAQRIPQATLRLYDGVGHAVSKTHKRRFEDDVLGFLRS
jgi:pimeloyl-ACP methyl ester carboxylesterase